MSSIRLGIPFDFAVSGFGFFGTIVGYNFVKYDAIARQGKPVRDVKMNVFIALSVISFIAASGFFLMLEWLTKVISVAVLLVTALYTLPFFPNKKTARDWAGLKIYFVALCWVGVTVVLPVLNKGFPLTIDFYISSLQRFILVIVLLFVFEIIDMQWDDPHLKTVPQEIGVLNTKILGVVLISMNLALELLKTMRKPELIVVNIVFGIFICIFLLQANQKRSRYYTTFWVEGITVVWWFALDWVSKNT
ncbi:hypothetical protein G6047_16465 [Flavobacterium sp. SE-s28]|uniref:Prenyltransferase n=1 Tax=Flavobacterium silvaticum TaxID=1852020 RepID=A0A972FQR4_9FLAO|nr:hypothetical protein [Flavobacterium silvaticum]